MPSQCHPKIVSRVLLHSDETGPKSVAVVDGTYRRTNLSVAHTKALRAIIYSPTRVSVTGGTANIFSFNFPEILIYNKFGKQNAELVPSRNGPSNLISAKILISNK